MVTIKNGRIQWPIQNGVDASLVINNEGGWDQFSDILMDFKYDQKINTAPIHRLSIGAGLDIFGTSLVISLAGLANKRWTGAKLYSDIKVKLEGKVLPPIPVDVILTNTVTDITDI